jgi:hypothetical protein
MKWQRTNRSRTDYNDAPAQGQKAFDKPARLPAANLLYPSLRAKKYDERARISGRPASPRAGVHPKG